MVKGGRFCIRAEMSFQKHGDAVVVGCPAAAAATAAVAVDTVGWREPARRRTVCSRREKEKTFSRVI